MSVHSLPPPGTCAFTVEAFCRAHQLSRASYYNLLKEGKAPKTFRVGRKPLISVEAAAEWRRRMEAEAENAPPPNKKRMQDGSQ